MNVCAVNLGRSRFKFSGAPGTFSAVHRKSNTASLFQRNIRSGCADHPSKLFTRIDNHAHTRSLHVSSAQIPSPSPIRSFVTLRQLPGGTRLGLSGHGQTSGVPSGIHILFGSRRWYSDKKNETGSPIEAVAPSTTARSKADLSKSSTTAATTNADSGKTLLDRLPTLHRPTKEELLAAATGFWHRLQIRFKWFSIRSSRPFNFDEIFAFASWIFWGHILWVVIGTTTFFGVTIWALNTVFTQEQVASWVAGYLTRSVGVQIVFESAIVPGWSDGKIRFRNVFISRRPTNKKRRGTVSKGSSATAAAAAAAEAQIEKDKMRDVPQEALNPEEIDDGNYTQFDLQVDTIEISLSFTKWFNGKGLLRDVEVRGVRGVLDRTHVKPSGAVQDPTKNRREHKTGDFEIDSFKLDDVLLTMYQPGGFRPYTISVFNGELPRLRKQWLFYDILNANNISGSFDDSLFTIHPRQVHGYTGAPLVEGRDPDAGQWKKHSRLRVDGLKIDHLNRGVEGPFSWIYEGNIDIVADYMIPNDADDSVAKVFTDIFERLETTVINPQSREDAMIAQNVIHDTDGAYGVERAEPETLTDDDKRPVVIDLKLHLNDVRASIPIFNNTLSYVNNAAVRPIIAYINSHSHGGSNFIPISCRVVKRLSDFDGSWTVFDCGLVNNVSREVYRAFVSDIGDRKHRNRRLRKVTLWAASVAAQALFIGLAGQLA